MKIVCPNCRTSYELTSAALGASGRSVRCGRCQTVWFADPQQRPAEAQAAAIEAKPMFTTIGAGRPAQAPSDIVEVGPAEAAASMALDFPSPSREPPAGDVAPQQAPHDARTQPIDPPAESAASAPTDAAPVGQPSTEPAAPPVAAEAAAEPPSSDIETIAKRRFSKRRPLRPATKPRWRISGIALAAAALVAIDAGLVLWRNDVVRLLPQTASLFDLIGLPVNLRELSFKDIHTTYEEHDGALILVIDGKIVAIGKNVVDVPRLRFAIQSESGHEIYAWTALPTRTKLAPGEALPFRTRLASPPEQGRTVKVRFFTRLDIASGLR